MTRNDLTVTITACDWSRNGVTGCGFYTVIFTADDGTDDLKGREFLATVYNKQEDKAVGQVCVNVLNLTQLLSSPTRREGIAWNNWRGDHFAEPLRRAIPKFMAAERRRDAARERRLNKVVPGMRKSSF